MDSLADEFPNAKRFIFNSCKNQNSNYSNFNTSKPIDHCIYSKVGYLVYKNIEDMGKSLIEINLDWLATLPIPS